MACLTDVKFQALRNKGYTGAMSDMVLQWLQANGATSGSISDAWKQVLDIIQPPDPSQRNDQWRDWLIANGYNANGEQMNDMETLFWLSGGVLVDINVGGGYSDGYSDGYN